GSLPDAGDRRNAREVILELREMIEGMADPHEARPDRAQIRSFERKRLEERLDLLNRSAALVSDRLAREPVVDGIDSTVSDVQGPPPGGFEGDGPSGASDAWLQTANPRRAALSRDPRDEPCECIEPRVEHNNACELEDATERR